MTAERFSVRFGDAPEAEMVRTVPANDAELLQRAMSMLEELSLADFLPEEFQDEYRALAKAWAR